MQQGLLRASSLCGPDDFFCYLDRINVGFARDDEQGNRPTQRSTACRRRVILGIMLCSKRAEQHHPRKGRGAVWIARIMILGADLPAPLALPTGPSA